MARSLTVVRGTQILAQMDIDSDATVTAVRDGEGDKGFNWVVKIEVPIQEPLGDPIPGEPVEVFPQGASVIQIFKGSDKQWYWRAKASNGEIVATGGEGYKRMKDATDEATALFPETPQEKVEA